MPRLTDPHAIRARLEQDRPWTAFALADLEPPYSAHASWFVPHGNPHAIGLLYEAFGTPLVLCSGQSDEWPDLLREIDQAVGEAREVYVVIRPELLPVIRFQYQAIEERPMVRMVLHPGAFRPAVSNAATRIGPA